MGESFISHQEILSDIGVLKELAILQESMVKPIQTFDILKNSALKYESNFRNGSHIESLNLPTIYANRSQIEHVLSQIMTLIL